MSFRAVVFDLDGTLVDTLDDMTNTMNLVLRAWGFPAHSADSYRLMISEGIAPLVTRALPPDRRDPGIVQACVDMFNMKYARIAGDNSQPYPGVDRVLETLEERGVETGVLSNTPDEAAKRCLAKALPRTRFSCVVGTKEGIPPKPDPTGAALVAEMLSIPPADIVYVGDSGVDMQTACAVGMYPLGVLWGFRSRKELLGAGAQVLIDRPLDLLSFLSGADRP